MEGTLVGTAHSYQYNKSEQYQSADITNIHDTFPAQIYALQQSLGDIQTALADIVEVTE